MRKKRKLLWIVCPLLIALLLASVTIWVIAENAETPTPSVSIEKFNLSFEDHVFLKYAVKLNEADAAQLGSENFRLLFWTSPHTTYEKGTENSSVAVLGTTKIGGEDYYTFAYTELAAKQMADTVYARAYINVDGNVYYSDVEKYSIVQYAYDVFHSKTATQELKKLVTEMLSYGAAAQDYFNYNENRPANGAFLQIEVVNGMLEDGFSKGLYLKGENFTLSAPETDAKGNYFSHWLNAKGEPVFQDNTATLIVGETEEVYTAVYVQTTPDEYFSFVEKNGSSHLNGTYMIYAKDINNLPSNIVIPSSYNGKPITALGIDAFKNCTNITNIIIPESIVDIGDSAFRNCTNLTQITFSENSQLTRIGNCSFENCSSLENISIPDTVTTIDVYAFWKCKKLTTVTFGENSQLTTIRFNAFIDCESLESITIPNNVTNIESSIFSGCKSLTNIVIPDNVTSIGDYAFSGCGSLTNIIIPDNVTSIGNYAFSSCEKLTNIVIPNNVTNIGEGAFAFSAIKSITLPNNITSIGKETFEYCDKLTNIMIPDSVITIGHKAFANCENLETVTFGERSQLTSIDSAAFIACTKLTAITISRGLISIGEAVFSSCTNLSNIYYLGTVTEWDSISIDTSNNPITATTIYYYSKTAPTTEGNYWHYDENGNPSIWEPIQVTDSDYFVFTELSDGTYSIKAKDINNIPANVIIPSNYNGRDVTKIDESAFSRCCNLTNITIPDKIISIGYYAFNECDSLESVTLSNRLVSIGAYTFNACRSLESITIPNSVTSIGDSAFNDCSGLTSITISKNVISIGRYAFSDCTSLTNIMIPNSVTSIDDFAFWGCTALVYFLMGTDVTIVGDYTFGECDNLKDIYYFGTADDWGKISIGSFNDSITNAFIYYYSETTPTAEGNYWHYVDGVPTKW